MQVINTEECMMQAMGLVTAGEAKSYGWGPDHTENTCQPTGAGKALYAGVFIFFLFSLLWFCCWKPLKWCCCRGRKRGSAADSARSGSGGVMEGKDVVVIRA